MLNLVGSHQGGRKLGFRHVDNVCRVSTVLKPHLLPTPRHLLDTNGRVLTDYLVHLCADPC